MRPVLVSFVAAHGVPGWLVPDYVSLAGLAATLGALVSLALCRRDGGDVAEEARTLALAYVAALLGGYVLEALRHVPAAVAARSFSPLLRVGRAAYGGFLGAALVAALYRLGQRQPLGPFFDRVSVGVGLSFFLVRIGCFLAGCDYGVPTAGPLGVRFPPGSAAAVDHARRGLVAPGAASLPVHPTQLYEAALGLLMAAAAWRWQRRPRDGGTFLRCLALYACGRYLIELLRGDSVRGIYLGLSTAQYISLGVLVGVALLFVRDHRIRGALDDKERGVAPGPGPAV